LASLSINSHSASSKEENMAAENQKTWIDEMVEREATPKALREGTVEEFCKKHDIDRSLYYYHLSKEENKKRVLEICLTKAKDEAPEVLDVLVQKAKKGDMKAMDIYIDSILKLAKNLDIKTDGEPITMTYEQALAIIGRRTRSVEGDSQA
jgi:hypothetical protein